MPIPDFQSLMLPFLKASADGHEHTLGEMRDKLASEFNLSNQELAQLLPSGRQPIFSNRVAWAKAHLGMAGLITALRRGCYKISQRGLEVLQNPPDRIDISFLMRYPEFVEFRTPKKRIKTDAQEIFANQNEHETPEEMLESAYLKLRSSLVSDLLSRVKESSSQFFERLVVELLLKMGYGGSREEAGEAIGKSGDEGIDGIINEDRLGLDTIYIQAKKWEGTVGRPEVHKFVGALHGKRAKKGVFITTGKFSPEAIEYVSKIDPKVVLIDGRLLTELMVDHDLGVTPLTTYQTKRIDSDYFIE